MDSTCHTTDCPDPRPCYCEDCDCGKTAYDWRYDLTDIYQSEFGMEHKKFNNLADYIESLQVKFNASEAAVRGQVDAIESLQAENERLGEQLDSMPSAAFVLALQAENERLRDPANRGIGDGDIVAALRELDRYKTLVLKLADLSEKRPDVRIGFLSITPELQAAGRAARENERDHLA